MKTISDNLISIVFAMLFVGMVAALLANSHHDPLGTDISRQLKEMGKAPHPETRQLKSFSRGPKQTISRVLFSPDGRIQQGRGDHQSRPAVADRLKQSTRKFRASHPQTLSYLILLRIGFAKLPPSPMVLVSSYLTFSPLPPLKVCTSTGWAVSFLLHFP